MVYIFVKVEFFLSVIWIESTICPFSIIIIDILFKAVYFRGLPNSVLYKLLFYFRPHSWQTLVFSQGLHYEMK